MPCGRFGGACAPFAPPLGPALVWVKDKSMQSFKNIYSVVMKLNKFFALQLFANGLGPIALYSNLYMFISVFMCV